MDSLIIENATFSSLLVHLKTISDREIVGIRIRHLALSNIIVNV